MSEQVERRLLELLDHPVDSPYGNPIPGLEVLGQVSTQAGADPGERLSVALDRPGSYRVLRLTEAVQTDPELLRDLAAAGVVPGAVIDARSADGYVAVQASGTSEGQLETSGTSIGLELSAETAGHIRVTPAA